MKDFALPLIAFIIGGLMMYAYLIATAQSEQAKRAYRGDEE